MLGFGTLVDRAPELRFEADGNDLGRPGTHQRAAPPASLELLDVVFRVLDLVGDGVEILVGQRSTARRSIGLGVDLPTPLS